MKSKEQRKPNQLLREPRLLRGWSLQRVVDELCALSSASDERLPGVNAIMVSNWETGTKKPSPFYRERLCKLYNMTADQLGFMDAPLASMVSQPIIVHPDYNLSRDSQYMAVFSVNADRVAQLSSYIGPESEVDMIFDPSKREAILKLLGIAGAAAIAPSNSDLWERLSQASIKPSALNTATLDQFERLIGDCWKLSNHNELETAERILSSFLPKILALPKSEGVTASLASHGLRLKSVLMHHHLQISEKVRMCEKSVGYARSAHDANTLVASLVELADAYEFNHQMDKCFQTLQEALHQSPQASPLVQARTYSNYAIILASMGRKQEALFYIQLAQEIFPNNPILDPAYALADSSIFTLSYHIGLVRLQTGQISLAPDGFESYKQHPSGDSIPERLRLEIVNGQSKAAIQEHDLEKYAHFLEDGIVSAVALGSKKRFDEAYTTFREDMPATWLSHNKIRRITEQYYLTRNY